ncbi:hypothetical protein BGZ92_006058, partial [Podila epicladia]
YLDGRCRLGTVIITDAATTTFKATKDSTIIRSIEKIVRRQKCPEQNCFNCILGTESTLEMKHVDVDYRRALMGFQLSPNLEISMCSLQLQKLKSKNLKSVNIVVLSTDSSD